MRARRAADRPRNLSRPKRLAPDATGTRPPGVPRAGYPADWMQRASATLPVRRAAPVVGPREGGSAPPPVDLGAALLSVVPDGVVTLGADGSIGRWSAAAERLSGRSLASVRRLGFAALFKRPTEARRLLATAAARRGPVEIESLLLHADGREVPVRLAAVALPTAPPVAVTAARGLGHEDGAALLVLLEDRSEVHTIRRRLIETEKLSAMAKIAGSIAHEIRNPLNSLFLSADLLEDELGGVAGGESVSATLGAIREEIERLNQIITHYLALSKIGGTERETVDLGRFVREFVDEQRERATARGVALRARGAAAPCLVAGDRHQLRRVLLNLVENALDALCLQSGSLQSGSPQAGPEGATPSRRRPAVIGISVKRFPGGVRLVVRDNGPGLAPSVRERPFEPFRSTKPRGAGLGLYLVREIVCAHGGTIGLLSAERGGTRVAIRLPAAQPRRGRLRVGR